MSIIKDALKIYDQLIKLRIKTKKKTHPFCFLQNQKDVTDINDICNQLNAMFQIDF